MLRYLITVLFVVSLAFAEIMTFSTPYPFLNLAYGAEGNIAVSTVGTTSDTTTYNVQCVTATADDCRFPTGGGTVIDGSSTIALSYSMDQVTYSVGCASATLLPASSSLATCSVTMYGSGIKTMSDVTSISAVETLGNNVMTMFATGTQDTAVVLTVTPIATQTASTATSTSGAFKELGAPKWCVFSAVGALLILAL